MASKGTRSYQFEPHVRVTTFEGDISDEQRLPDDVGVIQTWLTDYVSRPNHDLGRKGPVCPFIPPAMRADALDYVYRYDLEESSEEDLFSELLGEFEDFDRTAEPASLTRTSLASRLIVLPNTNAETWLAIDNVYESLKDAAVSRGLMVAQFHPNCDVRAVRNEFFRVAKSPLAAVAIRRMAPHDILFLGTTAHRFHEYEERFDHHYAVGRIHDPLLIKLYTDTHAKYATTTNELTTN
jgi:heptaprenyl diphosphate synthase